MEKLPLLGNKFKEGEALQVALFTVPPTQTSIHSIFYSNEKPVGQVIPEEGAIVFALKSDGKEFLDLAGSRLYIKCRIAKKDGTPITGADNVNLVANFFNSIWKEVAVEISGIKLTPSSSLYPYKSYIQTLMYNDMGTKSSLLTSAMYYEDTPGAHDTLNPTGNPLNRGLNGRSDIGRNGSAFEIEGYIVDDLLNQTRYIPNGVKVEISLYKNKPEFYLLSSDAQPAYKLVIEDIIFRLKKVALMPGLWDSHRIILKETTAKYPFTKTEIKQCAIPSGLTTFTWSNVFLGKCPGKVIVTFLSDLRKTGSYTKSPYKLHHYYASSLGFLLGGKNIMTRPYKLDYRNKLYLSAYNDFMHACGAPYVNAANGITRQHFYDGFTLYGFTFDPFLPDQEYLSLVRKGDLELEVTFAEPLPEPVACLIYSESPAIFEINDQKEVIYIS